MRYQIPRYEWLLPLTQTVRNAQPGDTIEVHTVAQAELAHSALERMGTLRVQVELTPGG